MGEDQTLRLVVGMGERAVMIEFLPQCAVATEVDRGQHGAPFWFTKSDSATLCDLTNQVMRFVHSKLIADAGGPEFSC